MLVKRLNALKIGLAGRRYGLRNAFDALRLFDYAQANPDLPVIF